MSKNLVKIIAAKTNDLYPNPWNTNKMSRLSLDKLKESIERLGSFKPVVVRETDMGFEILGGEHRWSAMNELGWETVEVANLGRIDDVTAKQIAVMDNERFGEDDELEFQALLADIQSQIDYDLTEIMDIDFDLDAAASVSSMDFDETLFDNLDDDPEEEAIERNSEKLEGSAATGSMMRFFVPVDQAEEVRAAVEAVIRSQRISTGNDMQNAGEALAFIINEWRHR